MEKNKDVITKPKQKRLCLWHGGATLRMGIGSVLMVMLLSGCMNAALTGANLVYHHNRFQGFAADNIISIDGQRRINEDSMLANTTISVSGFQTVALLMGHAQTQQQKQRAEALIWKSPGVKTVINKINVGAKHNTTSDITDSWITAKVKGKIIFAETLDPDDIKVTTDNGVVYLMGQLTQPQAAEAIELARNTTDVKKVVTLITYLVPSKVPVSTLAQSKQAATAQQS